MYARCLRACTSVSHYCIMTLSVEAFIPTKVTHKLWRCDGDRLPRTLFSLFWSMFGLVSVNSIEIKYPSKEHGSEYATSFPGGNTATSVVEGVGTFLFALYHVAIIIVLINMLIAMMSHSFECIQVCPLSRLFLINKSINHS